MRTETLLRNSPTSVSTAKMFNEKVAMLMEEHLNWTLIPGVFQQIKVFINFLLFSPIPRRVKLWINWISNLQMHVGRRNRLEFYFVHGAGKLK